MEGKHAVGLLAEARRALGRRDLAVDVLVLPVVCARNLGQEARHHLDDVGHRHLANLVLRADVVGVAPTAPRPQSRL